MNDLFFYLAIGGAIVITLVYGFYLMRKYPRTKPRVGPQVDPHLFAVDEAGNLTIREVEPSKDLKG